MQLPRAFLPKGTGSDTSMEQTKTLPLQNGLSRAGTNRVCIYGGGKIALTTAAKRLGLAVMDHIEFSRRGGKSRSAAKVKAVRLNLKAANKARKKPHLTPKPPQTISAK